jgi:hypothetical protein
MSFSPDVDKRIRDRFDTLLQEASDRLDTTDPFPTPLLDSRDAGFHALRMNFISLLQLLSTRQNHMGKMIDDVRKIDIHDLDVLVGMIMGLKSDYEAGMLDTIANMVEAEVASDYLSQAELLLVEGKSGNYDHLPAAVLTGAILEDTLRRLCQRQSPAIPVKTGKSYKKMSTMIDDLKKANVYNELKAKQLRAWADIRNSAAHGQFDEFVRSDVEQMLAGVQQFLADYM